MTVAYYNEYDRFAAAWLRELIADGLIAPGDVDERSIEDVTPADLVGYTQCHFFAGIGVWSLALRLAGWPDDRPIWTGSCPCQPFSSAGKGGGFADERHLWPALHWLIENCRPPIVIGEQVSSADGLAWLDVVLADLGQAGYTGGAVDTCAAGFGAPHIRQRLYWMARTDDARLEGRERVRERAGQCAARAGSMGGRLADASGAERGKRRAGFDGEKGSGTCAELAGRGEHGGLAEPHCGQRGRFADGEGCERDRPPTGWQQSDGIAQPHRIADRPGPTNGLWRAADWLGCRDGKWRSVEPGTFPLVAARSVRNRVGMLRGAGNALNVAQAEGFVRAMMETS